MRIVVSEFISLDGVVQAPGGPEEDTDGGFAHGGWSHPYFDEEVLGPAFTEGMERAEALLYGLKFNDIRTHAVGCALLAMTGAVAALVPAMRAIRLDPAVVLKTE